MSLLMLEAAMWPLEAATFLAVQPLLRAVGRGDAHPVLILPGFLGGDGSTVLLRRALRALGYEAHGWRLGRNIGPSARIVDGMRARVAELHDAHQRRVTLIGQSLGGVYARLLAREQPDLVRQVITLGSPFRMVEGDRSIAAAPWELLKPLHDGDLVFDRREHERTPLTVPATSIYSRTDGAAAWHACLDVVGDRAENIEVRGSHVGMAMNPAVVLAVVDRLAQPEDDWRPFDAPLALRTWYPRPVTWRESGRRTRTGQVMS